jgi:RimJ/RimL family protein N-acetyltransferase
MKTIDCTTLFLPLVCTILKYSPTTLAQCIICLEDGKPIAGVVYDGYNEVSISAHIWVDDQKVPSKAWYAAIFDYPFNRLGVTKLIGQVNSSNEEASKLDKHFGFIEEARVKGYSENGDMIIYTMTKDQCRILNSPAWAKVVNIISRVA